MEDEIDGGAPLVQLQEVYEPPRLFFRVCTTPLTELIRTTIGELRVNEPTIGFYLLLRTLAPTFTSTINTCLGQNVIVLVEDQAKNQTRCCLYGHVHLKSESELTELLPMHTVFVLKEPLLVSSSGQNFTVVVGSPSDFVVVGRSHVLYEDAEALGWREKTRDEGIRSASKWKQIGDELFQKGKHQEAGDAYLFALNNGGDIETNLLLNLKVTECFLAQDCYESAIKHVFNVLRVRPLDEEALYLAGIALYELRHFSGATLYYERLARILPTDEHVLKELGRCECRLSEAKGNVDIYKLSRACLNGLTPTDVAIFQRDLEFRPSTSNERGVFATEHLEPGTLILVDKPIVGFIEQSPSSDRGEAEFLQTVLKSFSKNPRTLGRKFNSLPGAGIQTSQNRKTFCDEVRGLEPIVDVRRLYQIVDKNIFKSSNTMSVTYQVYEKASRFRHSCLSNCTFVVYKDVITVRTCSPVHKGDELFLRYHENRLMFRDKQKVFERDGLSCSCLLCSLDGMESTEVHDWREALRSKLYSEISLHFGFSSQLEEKLRPIVRQLELTYKDRVSLRLLLFLVYCDLAKVVDRKCKDWKDKIALYVDKGLGSVGLSTALLLSCVEQENPQIPQGILVPEVLFDYAGLMAEMEYFSGRFHLVEKWVKVIILLERTYRGGNLEMLKCRYLHFRKVPSLLSFCQIAVLPPGRSTRYMRYQKAFCTVQS